MSGASKMVQCKVAGGGEKETGGGREAGSDSWKAPPVNYGRTLHWVRCAEFGV